MTRFLRRIAEGEIDDAHAAYLGVFEWLKTKGVRQWLRPLSRDAFVDRQRRGELFAHSIDGHVAAVVTLAFESSNDWTERLGDESRWWIRSLAVVRRWCGVRLGERVMQACEAAASQAGATEVFLDCVDIGFLPKYYAQLGYEELGRKDITYPSGNTFRVALMRKNCSISRHRPRGPTGDFSSPMNRIVAIGGSLLAGDERPVPGEIAGQQAPAQATKPGLRPPRYWPVRLHTFP